MASPVSAPTSPVVQVPGVVGEAGGSIADTGAAPLDFSALLLAQVDLQLATSGLPPASVPGITGETDEVTGSAGNVPPIDLSSFLAAVALPATGEPALPAQAVAATTDTTLSALAGAAASASASASSPSANAAAQDALLKHAGTAGDSFALDAGQADADAAPGLHAAPAKFADPGIAAGNIVVNTEQASDAGRSFTPNTPALHSSMPANAGATPTPPPTVRLDTPLADARWTGDFGQRILWIARQDISAAQLTVTPQHLGPIDIRLNLGGDNATAIFSSPHAEVRDALEAALPRLREMLAGAGISLGQANVNSQAQQHAANQERQAASDSPRWSAGSILHAAADLNVAQGSRHRLGIGLIDTFA